MRRANTLRQLWKRNNFLYMSWMLNFDPHYWDKHLGFRQQIENYAQFTLDKALGSIRDYYKPVFYEDVYRPANESLLQPSNTKPMLAFAVKSKRRNNKGAFDFILENLEAVAIELDLNFKETYKLLYNNFHGLFSKLDLWAQELAKETKTMFDRAGIEHDIKLELPPIQIREFENNKVSYEQQIKLAAFAFSRSEDPDIVSSLENGDSNSFFNSHQVWKHSHYFVTFVKGIFKETDPRMLEDALAEVEYKYKVYKKNRKKARKLKARRKKG